MWARSCSRRACHICWLLPRRCCRRRERAGGQTELESFPWGCASAQLCLLRDCQDPTCLSQALDMRVQWHRARPAPVCVHPAEGGGCPWTCWLCSSGLAGAGDMQGHAGLCMGLPGTGGVLCSGAAAGSSDEALLSPGTALPCLPMVQCAMRFVRCPGTAQWAPWHRSAGWEQKNNNRASGAFGTTFLKADTGNELEASHTLSNTQIQTIWSVGETLPQSHSYLFSLLEEAGTPQI